ncbi:MAG: hypothetical protein JNN15_16465 [Blastocatellia bacterium]|nr:hypothetical protein [Blastocatellia bacterium]
MDLRLVKASICVLLFIGVLPVIFFSSADIGSSDSYRRDSLLAIEYQLTDNFTQEESDPPEVAIGERLFLETRFAQFFFANSDGDVNKVLETGDPILEITETTNSPLPGIFAGQSINCRTCHLVDELKEESGGGNRSYSDFARRTLLPLRSDNKLRTVRNSPPLVNSTLSRKSSFFLHFDGEFTTTEELVIGTFTGRNFGWLPNEKSIAIKHIADVIRGDDGNGELAREFGGAYKVVLKGIDPNILEDLRLPEEFRIDVDKASDRQVLKAISKLVAAYVDSLLFVQDESGEFEGSPYDLFLNKNGLPRKPSQGETDSSYNRRLLQLINNLPSPVFVTSANANFQTHSQDFVFGSLELEGLKIFLAQPTTSLTQEQIARGGIGNCAACHSAPNFTDFLFHNTGETQDEYDTIFGEGAFMQLFIPDLKTRRTDYNAFLPPTEKHPTAQGPFQDIPSKDTPGRTDLGLWNVFANPDIPSPQKMLRKFLCDRPPCSKGSMLPKTIARFKTPGLRDLGHSAPYFHTGRKETLEDIVKFYARFGDLARKNMVRNAAPELGAIALSPDDVSPLVAFLRALNEDYE